MFIILLMTASSACIGDKTAWVQQQRIRGTYDFLHVDDRDHFAKLVAGGFNTVLLGCGGLDVDKPEMIAMLKKQSGWCKQLGLHLFVSNRLCGGALRMARPEADVDFVPTIEIQVHGQGPGVGVGGRRYQGAAAVEYSINRQLFGRQRSASAAAG